MGIRKNKLQTYALKDFNGQDKWFIQYYTSEISHFGANINCANQMTTRQVPKMAISHYKRDMLGTYTDNFRLAHNANKDDYPYCNSSS